MPSCPTIISLPKQVVDHKELDRLIKAFESIIPDAPAIMNSSLEQQEWGSVWAREEDIMAAFKAGVRYPSAKERKGAWQRFLALREMASQRAEPDRLRLRWRSEALRDEILELAEGARDRRMSEATRSGLHLMTVEEMRSLGRVLREAGRLLSLQKGAMLADHKEECFTLIQEIRATHDLWWSEHRKRPSPGSGTIHENEVEDRSQIRTDNEPGMHRKIDWERTREKKEEARARTRGHLERNRVKLATASDALERQQDHADDLRKKIASARSEVWRERFDCWLSGTVERIDAIEEWIFTLQAWIAEDQEKLDRMK